LYIVSVEFLAFVVRNGKDSVKMGFVKVQKNKAYYKRIQTKYRRRREGKTDYQARRKMVTQDKNKYNTPKYRLVVRISNKMIRTQVVYSTILGDRVLSQATSTEMANYGGEALSFKNYAAAYCTGLLIARRTLKKLGLDQDFQGVEEANGEEYHVEEEAEERRPFKVILDVGTIRTVVGSRCFGVLKGAVDGGLHVPHKVRKFTGYSEPEERGMDYTYDAGAHLERIMGLHVQEYFEMLQEEDQERLKVQFSKLLEHDVEADGIEDMYKEVHSKIREEPEYKPTEKPEITFKVEGNKVTPSEGTWFVRKRKLSYLQRKDRVKQKIQSAQKRMAGAMAGDDEEEE